MTRKLIAVGLVALLALVGIWAGQVRADDDPPPEFLDDIEITGAIFFANVVNQQSEKIETHCDVHGLYLREYKVELWAEADSSGENMVLCGSKACTCNGLGVVNNLEDRYDYPEVPWAYWGWTCKLVLRRKQADGSYLTIFTSAQFATVRADLREEID